MVTLQEIGSALLLADGAGSKVNAAISRVNPPSSATIMVIDDKLT